MLEKVKKYLNELKPMSYVYIAITMVLLICILYNIKEILGVLL